MKEITEDYVSFETAKLLKEKGFNEDCWCWYEEDGYLRESNNDFGNQSNSWHVVNDDEFNCSAPSLQRAMKWLREVHKIYIDINIKIILEQWAGYNISIYKTDTNDGLLDTIIFRKNLKDNISYEKACEAAIKYCLENLIQNNYEED